MKTLPIGVAVSFLVVALSAQSGEKQIVRPAPGQIASSSAAIRGGGLVYVSAITATNLKSDAKTQTREIFEQLRGLLTEAGSSIDNIAVATVTLAQEEDLHDVDDVFRMEFKSDPPARTLVMGNMVRPGALLEISVVAAPTGTPRRAILPTGWMKPSGPFSWAVRAGDTLFLSAMTPQNMKDGSLVHGDITTQTIALMDNADELLHAGGMSFDDTVSRRAYFRRRIDMDGINNGYRQYWPVRDLKATGVVPGRPTSMNLGVNLIGSHDVEITFVAVKNSSPREVVIPPNPDGTPGQLLPIYSPGIKIGNRLWVSGAVSRVQGDIRVQVTDNLNRLGPVLHAAGFDFKDVVAVEVYLNDITQYEGMNEGFRTFFPSNPPVRLGNIGINWFDPHRVLPRNIYTQIALIAIK